MDRSDETLTRRVFLKRLGLVLGAGAGAGALAYQAGWSPVFGQEDPPGTPRPYGPLRLARDEATGLELLRLPEGFRYRSLLWTGDPLDSGQPSPDLPDGMAAFRGLDGLVQLVRNHEVFLPSGPFDAGPNYDPMAGGGTTTLSFDPVREELVYARASLTGTLRNCAGGPTPWGSWLTCEEAIEDVGEVFRRPHGYVFEVPAEGEASGRPLPGLGRFIHEAAAVDPESGCVYLTEDQGSAGLYRFVPEEAGSLERGGALEMLRVRGAAGADLRGGQEAGRRFDVEWVAVPEPDRAHHDPDARDGRGVYRQGLARGGATFARLEGIWYRAGVIVFTSTCGGAAGHGQVWALDVAAQTLELLYESQDPSALTYPDNVAISARGGVVLCEDSPFRVARLRGLTPDGEIFPLVESHCVLAGERHGLRGDYRGAEFAGVCFSPDGRWLFLNIQTPGITFAITGPWGDGCL